MAPAEAALLFRPDDTIPIWAERVAIGMSLAAGSDFEEIRSGLIDMARYTKPLVGEDARDFANRAGERIAAIDRTLDCTSSASAIRSGESPAEWISRVGPLCLEVEDGESLDDVFPKLARIAERHPPSGGESARAWLQRVAPQIEEMNAQS